MPKAHPKLYDYEWLYQQYITRLRTYEDIGAELGVTKHSVRRAILRLSIEPRAHTSKFPLLNDKAWLEERYVIDLLSTKAIAELAGSSVGNVHSALKVMGIPLRDAKVAWHARFPLGRWGESHPNWKGGITSLNRRARSTAAYKAWRKAVFERDDYTCQFCRKRGGDLEADHILQFAYHIEARLDLNNGRTLCKPCHKTTTTFARKENM